MAPAQQSRLIEPSLLESHNHRDDCWIALHGKVYDVTAFLPDHPGGAEVVANLAGQDATDAFEEVGHSLEARQDALVYEIGALQGALNPKGAIGDRQLERVVYTSISKAPAIGHINWVPVIIICIFAFAAYWLTQRFLSDATG